MAGSSLTNLNCVDTEAALSYTREERRTRHSTAAYPSFFPGVQLQSLSNSITLYSQWDPRQGHWILEQLRFLPVPQQEDYFKSNLLLPMIMWLHAKKKKKKCDEDHLQWWKTKDVSYF